MSEEKDWIYYRIYSKPDLDDWYPRLLKEVVKPFVSQNEEYIDSFFFLKYHHHYAVRPYDEIETDDPMFRQGEIVWFIRFRVLTQKKNITNLEDELMTLIKKSPTVLANEKCKYNEIEDLGNRFGKQRVKEVRKYLEYACRLSLSLLGENRDQKYSEKISGLIHCPSNILEYHVMIPCPRCGQVIRFQP